MAELNTIITLRQGTTTEWADSSYKLRKGEMGLEYLADGSVKIKSGTGDKLWSELPYIGGEAANVFQVTLAEGATDDIAAIEAQVATENATKHDGDVAIVKSAISTVNGVSKYSYTSYVYESSLDDDGVTSHGWSAMDGNYSANNVYFSEDLMTTTAMGNISLTNGQATIAAKGKNIVDVFNTIYVKEDKSGLKKSSPSAKLSSTTTTYQEIGTTSSKDITVSMNDDGEYKYGFLPLASETGSETAGETAATVTTGTGTGVVVTETTPYELTFNGSALSPKTTNGATFTLAPAAQTTKTEMKMKGRMNYQQGGIPVSNLKKLYPAQRIAAGYDDTDEAIAFRWYIPFYQGFTFSDTVIADPDNITAAQLTTGLAAPVTKTSDGKVTSTIKDVTKITGSSAYSQTKITAAVASKAWRQYFLAYPTSYGFDMTGAKDANGIDCTVKKAKEVTVNINGTDVKYTVYYINNAADYGTLGITWSIT